MDNIAEFNVRNASNKIWRSVLNPNRPDTFQTRVLVHQKEGGYFDFSCRGPFYSDASISFDFYCFMDSVVFFTSSETGLHWSFRLLNGYLHIKSD